LIFDAHCDVLYQLHKDQSKNFQSDRFLHVTHEQLKAAGSKVQCMAIFLPPETKANEKIVNPNNDVKVISSKNDIDHLKPGEVGVVLTLEGCEAIEEDLTKLRTLYRLGVRSVGLTWNPANAVADGAMEERGGGLTAFGREVVKQLNSLRLWTDVSHLSERGFWDVIELADYPIASHSNCYELCQHPRNLKDKQIDGLIKKDGMIGLTFVPFFVKEKGQVDLQDLLLHVEHICERGGERNLGFGSDFDGIDETIRGLSSFKEYSNWIDLLQRHYSEEQVENFLFNNFINRFPSIG